jgi:hypothetical protein
MPSIPVSHKKRGRPATGQSPRIGLRLAPATIAALDAFRDNNPDSAAAQNRSELLRVIITDWLIGAGYLKPEDDETAD